MGVIFIQLNCFCRIQVPTMPYMLAVSRCLGDWSFKLAHRGVLIADPEVKTIELEPFRDLFLIIATDGVWDVCSTDNAVRIVAEALNKFEKMGVEREEEVHREIHPSQNGTTQPRGRYLFGRLWTSSEVLRLAAKALIEECVRRKSEDNLTVTVIRLAWHQDVLKSRLMICNAPMMQS